MLHLNGIVIDPVRRTIKTATGEVFFIASNNSPYLRPTHSAQFDIVCRLVIGTPATHVELWEVLYGHDENGGPDGGNTVISVMLNHLKPKLETLGLRLHKMPANRNNCYRQFWIAP